MSGPDDRTTAMPVVPAGAHVLTDAPPGDARAASDVPDGVPPADGVPLGDVRQAQPAPPVGDPRWTRLAGEFVDEPEQAVDGARRLVREAVEALLTEVDPGDDVQRPDTERLRLAFRRYRDLHAAVSRL